MTIKQFTALHRISITSKLVAKRPGNDTTDPAMQHYRVTLHHGRHSMRFYYSMGMALTGGPVAHEVLHSLALDASADGQTFEQWAGEFGYDTDSRQAERTYRACLGAAKDLRRVFGDTIFAKLLETTED